MPFGSGPLPIAVTGNRSAKVRGGGPTETGFMDVGPRSEARLTTSGPLSSETRDAPGVVVDDLSVP